MKQARFKSKNGEGYILLNDDEELINETNNQGNEEPMPLTGIKFKKKGMSTNTKTLGDETRDKLGGAVRNRYQGHAVLMEVIDEKTFRYVLTETDGSTKIFKANYKVTDFGIIDVDWNSASIEPINEDFPSGDVVSNYNAIEPLAPTGIKFKKRR